MFVLHRWLIVVATISVSAIAGYFGGKSFVEKYESTGVLTADLGIADYKKLYELLSNGETLRSFVALQAGDSPAGQVILSRASGRDPLKNLVSPVYRSTRSDVRDLGDIKDSARGNTAPPVLGLRLTFAAEHPKVAQEGVHLLAQLIRDVALTDAIAQWTLSKDIEATDGLLRADAERTRGRFEITQARQKIVELKRVMSAHPQSQMLDARQIVSLGNGAERFLSPATQIVAEETRIIDLSSQEARLERSLRQLQAAQALHAQLRAATTERLRGEELVNHLGRIVSSTLNPFIEKDDAIRELHATYLADLATMKAQWISKARFLSGPTTPTEPSGLNRKHTAYLSAFLALVLSIGVFFWARFKDGVTRLQDALGLGSASMREHSA